MFHLVLILAFVQILDAKLRKVLRKNQVGKMKMMNKMKKMKKMKMMKMIIKFGDDDGYLVMKVIQS